MPALRRRRPYNPAYLNPGRRPPARRRSKARSSSIESAAGEVRAVAHPASDVREGVVSMAHGFDSTRRARTGAANAATLVDDVNGSDALSGLPRMSAIPVRVRLAGA